MTILFTWPNPPGMRIGTGLHAPCFRIHPARELPVLDWSAWRRLTKMRRLDAVSFLTTAIGVLVVNAVGAVAAGCLIYAVPAAYNKFAQTTSLRPAAEAVE